MILLDGAYCYISINTTFPMIVSLQPTIRQKSKKIL